MRGTTDVHNEKITYLLFKKHEVHVQIFYRSFFCIQMSMNDHSNKGTLAPL